MRGRHQITFGAELQHTALEVKTDNQQNPLLTFDTSLVSNAFAAVLLGEVTTVSQTAGSYIDGSGVLPGFYGEDKIKVSSRLTLTAGLRWDPYFAFSAAGGRM